MSESEIFKIVPFDADDDHFLQVTLVNESPVVKVTCNLLKSSNSQC